MFYVYILQSIEKPDSYYVGLTQDLKRRLQEHNAGESTHTRKFLPWRVSTYLAFSDKQRAQDFELYLKSASGRAFAKKRL